jgi:hypothetical protein
MIPAVLLRGAIPKIKVQIISNHGTEQPLGPGIYATSSIDTVNFYTSRGKVVYQLFIDDSFRQREHSVIELSSKFCEHTKQVQNKIKIVLEQHYSFLELDKEKDVKELLFNREVDIDNFNQDSCKSHEEYFRGSIFRIPHFVMKAFFDFLKPKVCKTPLPKKAPKEEDIVQSLVLTGIWMGIGSIEGTYSYNGAMDSGIQYLFYDESAIIKNVELTEVEFDAMCEEDKVLKHSEIA